MAKKVTINNYEKVLDAFKEYLNTMKGDKYAKNSLKLACSEFNSFLDELANNDFFGTEGQCDPRGDQR